MPEWTVRIGPGPRLAGLGPVLEALSPAVNGDLETAFEALGDLADLLAPARAGSSGGRLVLDGDHVSVEDIGFLRRFLARNPRWGLLVVGQDAGSRATRSLLALPRTHWLQWPPDLDQMRELVRSPGAATSSDDRAHPPDEPVELLPVPRRERPRTPRPTPEEAAQARRAARRRMAAEQARRRDSQVQDGATDDGAARVSAELPQAADQVARLAEIGQSLELAFAELAEGGELPDGVLDSPSGHLRRLLRFTRSLEHLTSPPARGDEEFDMGALLEEQLAGMTLRARKGPRFLPRGPSTREGEDPAELIVHGHRAALAGALEAILSLARGCTGAGEIVRVPYGPISDEALVIDVDFPEGPLAGVELEHALEPFGLREELDGLGPNDLAAARAVLASQGGSLGLARTGDGHLRARIELPLARPSTAIPVEIPAGGDENDPFA